jgi:UDP-glucose 4-epimerase
VPNILITGCNGYIGSIICETILDYKNRGDQNIGSIFGLDDFSNSKKENLGPGILFYNLSLVSSENLCEILTLNKIDTIIHTAAEAQINNDDPDIFYQSNVAGTLSLLKAAKLAGVKKFINSSSASIFGLGPNPKSDKNSIGGNQTNHYGKSKRMVELMLDDYSKAYQMQCVSFRYFNVVGATLLNGEDRIYENHIIPRLFHSVITEEPFQLYGSNYISEDGSAERDYIDVRTVAEANHNALGFSYSKEKSHKKISLCSGKPISNLEIIHIVEEVTGNKIKIEKFPKREGDPAILYGDPARMDESFNLKKYTLKQSIESAWQFFQRKHPDFIPDTSMYKWTV